jgi:hypothetical protein
VEEGSAVLDFILGLVPHLFGRFSRDDEVDAAVAEAFEEVCVYNKPRIRFPESELISASVEYDTQAEDMQKVRAMTKAQRAAAKASKETFWERIPGTVGDHISYAPCFDPTLASLLTYPRPPQVLPEV